MVTTGRRRVGGRTGLEETLIFLRVDLFFCATPLTVLPSVRNYQRSAESSFIVVVLVLH